MKRFIALFACLPIAALVVLHAEEPVDQSMIWKIRREGTANSKVLQTIHMLTDVYGPRLTGSPNLKAAGEWAASQMRSWGMTNTHLEPWDFGHPGWTNDRLVAHIVTPVKDALVVEALAWTPGTNGVARGSTLSLTLPERATASELKTYLDTQASAVKGKMVLVGPPVRVRVAFNPTALRRDDAEVLQPNQQGPPRPQTLPQPGPNRPLSAREVDQAVNEFLVAHGALVRINDAGREHGQIRAFNNRTFDPAKAPPTLVMRNEDYGRIWRLSNGAFPGETPRRVDLEVEIVNTMYPEGSTVYNVVGEIAGSDKADEVVMLGGHLDSWHAATGATDNAVGSAIMMEAARILATVGVTPRRTIRVALWSGEEQGLLGSQAYVKEHFGTEENRKPEYAKFNGYFNIDSGTGRARSLSVFGPPAAGTVLRETVASLDDLGVLTASATTSRAIAGTDSTSFNAEGLPGIGVMQDPIEYGSNTWHTNLDTYERIVEDDVKSAAIVIASAVYHLAMRNDMLPRFASGQMPPRPPSASPAPATPAATPATPPATTPSAPASRARTSP